MGHFTAALAPQPRNGVEPRAVGRPVQQDQAPGRSADHGPDCIIGMGIRVIPRHREGTRGLLVDEGLQAFGNFLAAFAASAQPHGFARLIGDRTQTAPLAGLTRRGDPALLPLRAPQRPQRGPPTAVACVGVVAHGSSFQGVAGLVARLLFT